MHSVHQRDGGFCEGKERAGRDLDKAKGGLEVKNMEKLYSSHLPRF